MKKETKDVLIIGAALFAMFFGAGNLIFPPAIGVIGGDHWMMSFLGFFITGICLPVMGVLAVSKAGGNINDLASKVGVKFATILGAVVVLAIGPLLAIPRTAATVYEIGVKPMFAVHPLIVSIIYFSITLYFVIQPSGIVDKIGKILTPILLLVIGFIIYSGVVNPLGTPAATTLANPFSDGFLQGYQTMDTLGAILMGGIILTGIIEKGYLQRKEQLRMTTKAGIIAGSLLAIVYGGLLYLGATISGSVAADISKSALIMEITNRLLGQSGQLVMSVAVSAACMTTSIALTAIVGSYFEKLSKGKLTYRLIVTVTCIFSAIMAAVGVEAIVQIAVPFLVLAYPVVIILIVFNLLDKFIPHPYAYKGGVAGAFAIGLLDALKTIEISFIKQIVQLLEPLYTLVDKLPLANMGFSWLIPSLVLALIATFIGMTRKSNLETEQSETEAA
ncbi:branched-chain amino acid transport system II carrier protein [Clostridium sp.]|jgi:LIVCS family branched-chain amino acid:cation transporter|uniref:branched-chain amino acid transport system II carrier protein n=1 Tax=Clostridium sp. TaxID=1506 RepID=UPI003EE82C31